MSIEISTKIKALTLAIMINGLMLGAAAYLFDGRLHSDRPFTAQVYGAAQQVSSLLAVFRP